MKRLALSLAISLSLLNLSQAQQYGANTQSVVADNHSSVTSDNIIDGSTNAEQIPDLTAYRLWFLAVSADVQDQPDKSEIARQSHLRAAHIADAEISAADVILVQFKSNYAELIANYNGNMAAGDQPSLSEFLTQRDLLVQRTMSSMQETLSSDSFNNLQVHIIAEKNRMKVPKEVK